MRRRRIVAGALVLSGILLALGIRAADRWVARQRNRIAALAADALGRELLVGEVSLDLWGRIGVQLRGVKVFEAPEFGGGEFLEVPRVRARLAFWPLLQRKVEVARVSLERPRLQIVRDARGRWNYESLRFWSGRERRAEPSRVGPSPGAALAWLVAALDVEDGRLDFVDRSRSPARSAAVRRWYARARDVRIDQPFEFELRAAVDAEGENLALRGEVGPVDGGDRVPVRIRGVLGPHPAVPLRVEIRELEGSWQGDRLQIDSLRSRLLGGELEARGTIVGAGEGARASVRARGLEAQALARLAGARQADRFEGRVALEAEVAAEAGSGTAIERSLVGTGRVAVAGGKLRGWNALRELSEQFPDLPGFEGLREARRKPPYAQALAREDTLFQSLSARFGIAKGQLQIEESEVLTEDYAVGAKGSIDFSGRADLRGTLALSRTLSSALASDAGLARYLMDPSGRLSLPFRYRGRLGSATPTIDIAAIAERWPERWFGKKGKELLPRGWERGLRDLLDGRLLPR